MRKPLRERRARIREMLQHQRKAEVGEQLEAGEPLAARIKRTFQQIERAIRTLQGGDRGGAGPGKGKELQDRRGDHPERAFRADEELLEIVAGVVLAQAAQAIPYLARGKHDLQAQDELARVAIAQHPRAPRVGRQVAADFAAALGSETQWKK